MEDTLTISIKDTTVTLKKGTPVIYSYDNITYYIGYYRFHSERKDIVNKHCIFSNRHKEPGDIIFPPIIIPLCIFDAEEAEKQHNYGLDCNIQNEDNYSIINK